MISFTETGLQQEILDAVHELGFETPTPIQAKTIPHLLSSGQDLIAFAQTGTGKTAAFGLPVIHLTDVRSKNTQTLVLCPTRELCMQITRDLSDFSKYLKPLNVVAVYGGASIENQIKALSAGAQIVVATPGRAKDLILRKKLQLRNVERVVLDEADEMLSMGFKEDIDEILASTPKNKQISLFSATMSKEVTAITRKFMNDPIELSVAPKNTGAENVEHLYYMVHSKDRYEVLKRIADMNPSIYGIVFCRTRRETSEVAGKLMNDGYNADALHGDLSQAQRDEVMGRFRQRQLQLLVATDVAARGLDVTDLTHIINYNLPDENETYTHRSGRTGRAGKTGTSIAIIHTKETGKLKDIAKRSGITFKKEAVPGGKEICQKQLYALIDKMENVEVDEKQIEPFLPSIYEKLAWLDREELIKRFVSAEFNRFLSYYKDSRDLNVSESSRERSDKSERKNRKERGQTREVSFTRLYISVGSKNRVNPGRLIGMINEGLDSSDAEIGRIEILKNFSFIEIEDQMANAVVKALNGNSYDGESLLVEISKEKPAFSPKSKSKPSKSKDFNSKKSAFKPEKGKRNGNGSRRKNRY
ncbi:MAG: DEAD/DEAH box helicase [Bacteroidales bacterium]|nr:DEAD/DEAH box helicase [Bacteroidales bacterium]